MAKISPARGQVPGSHYCEECWTRDDDDNKIVTSDSRKWDDYDHKEIKKD